jgi:hypothetical protein
VSQVAVDPQGNVIIAGTLYGTADFGGGPLVQQGVQRNIFVAKYDCAGAHLWSKVFGNPDDPTYGDNPAGMVIDSTGAILLTGDFAGTLDFGKGPLVSKSKDGFMAKLDASGNGVWSKRFGGTQFNDSGLGVAVDPSGNAYFSGFFLGAQNFGGGVIGNDMQVDLFVVKFDPSGNHLWSKTFGHSGVSAAITLDAAGNVLLCGGYSGASLDFGGGVLPAGALYVSKLNSSGGFLLSKVFSGGGGSADCSSVTIDASGNIVLTGQYKDGAVDFGGGPLPNDVGFVASAAFVAKLTSTGDHVFSKGTGYNPNSSATYGAAVAANSGGDVYVVGGFGSPIDFGGGPVSCAGSDDIFVTKLGPTGAFGWTKSFGNQGNQGGSGLALDPSGAPILGGYYGGNIDFGSGALPAAMGNGGGFIAELLP